MFYIQIFDSIQVNKKQNTWTHILLQEPGEG